MAHTLQVVEELGKLGVAADAIEGILQALTITSVEQLEEFLGAGEYTCQRCTGLQAILKGRSAVCA